MHHGIGHIVGGMPPLDKPPEHILMTSGGHHCRPVQACSLIDLPHGTDISWAVRFLLECVLVFNSFLNFLKVIIPSC